MQDHSYDWVRHVHRITLYNTVNEAHQHVSDRKARLYLHLDMNCFYAQVEQQAYNLYGMPVIVGAWRGENGIPKGIVTTASYEARAFGIKTGMSHLEAVRLCPHLIPLRGNFVKYQSISQDIADILRHFTPTLESYSIDEFFLDITHHAQSSKGELMQFAREVKAEIHRQLGLVCSLGIARSKTYAKVASDLEKPDGLSVIFDETDVQERIHPLPVGSIWGIGRKRIAKLNAEGIHTIADAVSRGSLVFERLFGASFGKMLYLTCAGRDVAKVMDQSSHIPREISYMHSFTKPSLDSDEIRTELLKAIALIAYRMRGYGKKASRYCCYLRLEGSKWKGLDLPFHTEGPTSVDDFILKACETTVMHTVSALLRKRVAVRGIGFNTMNMSDEQQEDLFFREDPVQASLYQVLDKVNNTFGQGSITKASLVFRKAGKHLP